MKKDENILKELREISPMLADIRSSMDLFRVPDGYFEALAGEIMAKIRLTEDNPSPVLDGIGKQNPYQAPAGYFEDFASALMKKLQAAHTSDDVSKELESISPLLSVIEKKPAYSVPENYFPELPARIQEGIEAVEFVQSGLDEQPAWLSDLKTKETYSVPGGYFEGLAAEVLAKTKLARPQAKLVSLAAAKPWMKYAAAAAFTGVLLTIGFFTFNHNKNNINTDPIASLSKVSNQEMINYLENQNLPVDENVVASGPAQDLNDNDVRDLFDDISDADLIQYANASGGLKDL